MGKFKFSNTSFFILFIALLGCKSTFRVIESPTDYSKVVARGNLRGTVFLENFNCFYCEQHKTKFSPSIDEISLAENLLKSNIQIVNSDKLNQGNGCPIIHKNLNKYLRQYMGYIDANGEKIIHVNFEWNRYSILQNIRGIYRIDSDSWKREWQISFDGCSFNWELKINLAKEKLFDLSINGLG